MIILLILWGIIGLSVMDKLVNDGDITNDTPLRIIFPLCLICGPITTAAILLGLCLGVLEIIIHLLS